MCTFLMNAVHEMRGVHVRSERPSMKCGASASTSEAKADQRPTDDRVSLVHAERVGTFNTGSIRRRKVPRTAPENDQPAQTGSLRRRKVHRTAPESH